MMVKVKNMKSNQERCLLIVRKLELFCKKYKRWPYNREIPANKGDRDAKNLYNSLFQIGYLGELEFLDYTIRNQNGELIIDVIDRLYEQYNKKAQLSFLTHNICDIKRYCGIYKEWPEIVENPMTHQEIMATRCRTWLDKRGFNSGDKTSFEFHNLRDKNGVLVIDFLTQLYVKMQNSYSSEEVLKMVDAIVNFCDEEHRWLNSDGSDNERILATWLEDEDGYLKHKDELYTKGLSVKNIIELYRGIYSEGQDLGRSTFLCQEIIRKGHYMFHSFQLYNEFQTIILEEIRKQNLKISFRDIAFDIALPLKERIKVYQRRYTEFVDKGDDVLASLYYTLYLHSFIRDTVLSVFLVRKRCE